MGAVLPILKIAARKHYQDGHRVNGPALQELKWTQRSCLLLSNFLLLQRQLKTSEILTASKVSSLDHEWLWKGTDRKIRCLQVKAQHCSTDSFPEARIFPFESTSTISTSLSTWKKPPCNPASSIHTAQYIFFQKTQERCGKCQSV